MSSIRIAVLVLAIQAALLLAGLVILWLVVRAAA